ncbi:MGMT family protein [Methanococcus maripaludis]|jgi:methylated-DNA-[protein]-cysteine S-methyltransferase|uniref:MGMT family protein n=1 Tax=Methanococcus maripaludis TaxID=39152 RepID=A0A8T3W8Y5_METMI|nr:MGMT family protein [Methanococcus maripaludis]MBG0769999.1 MGMT family protein [Methanococcus maripaludis]MDK2929172.1 methylated-DNA-[protein]-cysteine S-methyltransferase [Methanococcus sp.]
MKTFNEQCYDLIMQIPKGKVTTYKIIAEALNTKAYRAVGNAMKNNPKILTVSCHRVVNSNGYVGGYVNGVEKKIEILKNEGVVISGGKITDLKKYLFVF